MGMNSLKGTYILAIETSCDETAAAILYNQRILANVISSQLQHSDFGGVIPELASRLHQQQIIQVVNATFKQAGIDPKRLDAVAVTQGPGLLGALLVGMCFAKAYAWAMGVPVITVNHMEAHVLANFLNESPPSFPFLCLTVSGGHTQLVLIKDYLDMQILGQTIDDAAGEAFDKAAKMMNLPYPGGPHIDRLAKSGNAEKFSFPTPDVDQYAFSFSGLKTALLYLIRDEVRKHPGFLEEHLADLCASYQHQIITILLDKLQLAARETGVRHLAIAGGVSANSELRASFKTLCLENNWISHIPALEYSTDNAAMIGIAGYYKLLKGKTSAWDAVPYARKA